MTPIDDIKIDKDVVINGDVTTTGNLDIGAGSVVNGTCIPAHPNCTGALPPFGGNCDAFRDTFSLESYSNQDGTLNWQTDWNEVDDNGSPSGGDIRINTGELEFRGGGSGGNPLGGPYIEREADLSAYTTATLTFDYRESGNWEASDQFEVYVSSEGGSSWTLIQTFTDDQGGTSQPFSYDITTFIATNTRIAFVEKADSNGERFYLDNVQIEGCASVVDHFRITPEISTVSEIEVTTSYAPGTHVLDPTGNNMRFGRLRMDNVYGSELNPLLMPVFTEFWNGTSFQKNILDTCTTIANADLVLVASPPALSVPAVVNAPASAGDANYSFPAPGAGNDGFVDTTTDLNSAAHLWLRFDWDADGVFDNDPTARVNFGIFGGDPVQIYIQQIYE